MPAGLLLVFKQLMVCEFVPPANWRGPGGAIGRTFSQRLIAAFAVPILVRRRHELRCSSASRVLAGYLRLRICDTVVVRPQESDFLLCRRTLS